MALVGPGGESIGATPEPRVRRVQIQEIQRPMISFNILDALRQSDPNRYRFSEEKSNFYARQDGVSVLVAEQPVFADERAPRAAYNIISTVNTDGVHELIARARFYYECQAQGAHLVAKTGVTKERIEEIRSALDILEELA